jgi:hypothetical protein
VSNKKYLLFPPSRVARASGSGGPPKETLEVSDPWPPWPLPPPVTVWRWRRPAAKGGGLGGGPPASTSTRGEATLRRVAWNGGILVGRAVALRGRCCGGLEWLGMACCRCTRVQARSGPCGPVGWRQAWPDGGEVERSSYRSAGLRCRNSYAPPVSGAKLRSARVGAKLGRPVNAAVARFFFFFVWFFLSFFLVLLFSSVF